MFSGHEERSVKLDWSLYCQYLLNARQQIYQALITAFSENQPHTEVQAIKDQANVLKEFKDILDTFAYIAKPKNPELISDDSFDLINKAYIDFIQNFNKEYKTICKNLCHYPIDLLSEEKQGICLFFIKISHFIDYQYFLAEKIQCLSIPEFIQKDKRYTDFLTLSFDLLDSVSQLKMHEDGQHLAQTLYDMEMQLYRKNYVHQRQFSKIELSYDNTIRSALSSILEALHPQSEVSKSIHRKQQAAEDITDSFTMKETIENVKINLGLRLKEVVLEVQEKLKVFDQFEKEQMQHLEENEKYIAEFLEVLNLVNQSIEVVNAFYADVEKPGVNSIDYWISVIKGKSKTERIPLANIDRGWGSAAEIIRSQLFDHIKYVFDGLIKSYQGSLESAAKITKRINLVRQNYSKRKQEVKYLRTVIDDAICFYDEQLAPSIQSTLKRLAYKELSLSKLKAYWYLVLPPAAVVAVAVSLSLFFFSALSVASLLIVSACAFTGASVLGFLGVYYKLNAVNQRFPVAKKLMELEDADADVNVDAFDLSQDSIIETPGLVSAAEKGDDFVLLKSISEEEAPADRIPEHTDAPASQGRVFFGLFANTATVKTQNDVNLEPENPGNTI